MAKVYDHLKYRLCRLLRLNIPVHLTEPVHVAMLVLDGISTILPTLSGGEKAMHELGQSHSTTL